jgi:polyhydroxybutyrate depolymerase
MHWTARLVALAGLSVGVLTSPATARDARPQAHTITVGGVERSYLLEVPDRGGSGGRPVPLVLALHGGAGTAERLVSYLGLSAVAEREGFAVAYPQGIDKGWNDGRAPSRGAAGGSDADDVTFLTTLVDRLVAARIADPARIYVMGISNGGGMVLRLACEASDRFAGFAAIIAAAPAAMTTRCRPSRPLPMLILNGTADPIVPYSGAASRAFDARAILSPPDHVAFWAQRNGCGSPRRTRLPDRDPTDASTVEQVVYEGCRQRASVVFLSVAGGGHQPPSTRSASLEGLIARKLGPRNHDIDTAESAWAFFRDHAK